MVYISRTYYFFSGVLYNNLNRRDSMNSDGKTVVSRRSYPDEITGTRCKEIVSRYINAYRIK